MSYDQLSEEYKTYICALTQYPESSSFTQARKFYEWFKDMNEEFITLENSQTWLICSLPPDKHAIGCKCVYKIKLNDNGSLKSYKTRLVAKGYIQHKGVDFVDIFFSSCQDDDSENIIGSRC